MNKPNGFFAGRQRLTDTPHHFMITVIRVSFWWPEGVAMAQQCPNCDNRAVLNGRCMTCGWTAGAAPSAGGGKALTPQPPERAPGAPGATTPANPTGAPILPQPAAPNQPAARPTPPMTIHTPPPGHQVVNIPPANPPGMQLHDWIALKVKGGPPLLEGIVEVLDGPHAAQTQPSVWRQILTAWGLGKISPWMAGGGYLMGRKDFHVWTCRLRLAPPYQAANNNSPAAVVYVANKQPQVGFQQGDTIAIWGGMNRDHNLIAERVYVYDTNSWVSLKT